MLIGLFYDDKDDLKALFLFNQRFLKRKEKQFLCSHRNGLPLLAKQKA
jgi:hypothetical protein